MVKTFGITTTNCLNIKLLLQNHTCHIDNLHPCEQPLHDSSVSPSLLLWNHNHHIEQLPHALQGTFYLNSPSPKYHKWSNPPSWTALICFQGTPYLSSPSSKHHNWANPPSWTAPHAIQGTPPSVVLPPNITGGQILLHELLPMLFKALPTSVVLPPNIRSYFVWRNCLLDCLPKSSVSADSQSVIPIGIEVVLVGIVPECWLLDNIPLAKKIVLQVS